MKILVPVKNVGTLDEDFELRDDGKGVDPDFVEHEINEWDNASWEEALRLHEGDNEVEIIPLTVGPEDDDDALRQCLAKGGERGIRVWDDSLEDADPLVVSRIIAKVAEKEGADLVFAGALSSDDNYAQTGISAAALLGWPHVAVVSKLDYEPGANKATVQRELEGGLQEEMDVECPALLTIQVGINDPRYASLRGIKQAKAKPIDVLSPTDLGLGDDEVGEAGSASRVRRMFVPEKGQAELLEGTPAEQAQRIAEIIKELRGDN